MSSHKKIKKRRFLLDIGNTSVTYGVASGRDVTRYGTSLYGSIPYIIKKNAKSGSKSDIDVVIASVVPKRTAAIRKALRGTKGLKLWEVGKNLPITFPHRYRKSQLGIDRLIDVYGALKLKNPPLLVINFGTAVTLDFVSKKGQFEGGMIIPGPEISFQSLLERAALIPKRLRLPRKSTKFIGRNTYDCMKAGVLEGYGAMTDGLIMKFRRKYAKSLKVITTGGFAAHLKPHIKTPHTYEPHLSIKALNRLFLDFIS